MITQLRGRSLLKLTGSDVQSFLQGQFSNDIDALEDGVAQLNAYCQHQGKIIALIWVMKSADDFYLSFASDLSEIVTQKLTMFKMMSDVTIENLSDSIIQLGLIDESLGGAYKLNNQQSIALVETLDGVELNDANEWEVACIAKSIPEVTLTTSEKFVPQMLNLDIDEVGVSFTKGCYPGQEVVARLHYLGKAKRRMYQFESDQALQVGDELQVEHSKSAKATGLVVRSVKLDAKSLCLATLEIAHENDTVTINNHPINRIHHD